MLFHTYSPHCQLPLDHIKYIRYTGTYVSLRFDRSLYYIDIDFVRLIAIIIDIEIYDR